MRLMQMLGLVALVCVAMTTVASAATVGVYFDDQATTTTNRVRPWESFNLHVVMTAVEDQVTGVEYKLNLPPELVILNRAYWGGDPILIGSPAEGYMVGLGECVSVFQALPGQERLVVETLEVMAVGNFDDQAITLTKFEGGSEAPSVTAPRYSNCDDQVEEMTVVNATVASGTPTIGLYFDDQATSTQNSVRPYQTFNMYVILTDIEDKVTGVEYKLNLPAELVVAEHAYWGSNPIVIGTPTDGYAIGLGQCVNVFSTLPGSESLVVETLQAFAFQNFNTQDITLTKYTGGTQGPTVNAPRYSNCDDNVYEMNVVNAQIEAPVAAQTVSWGAVKSHFNE
jgi:hypothetical protein